MLVPKAVPYAQSGVSLFEELVTIGERRAFISLSPLLHNFLATCLFERMRDTSIVSDSLALALLESPSKFGEQANAHLKRTGDQGLILAGLFPERAARMNVSRQYLRLMGQSAYACLAARLEVTARFEGGKFYDTVAKHFQDLEKVLSASRPEPDVLQRLKLFLSLS
jgi:hypothetical protein